MQFSVSRRRNTPRRCRDLSRCGAIVTESLPHVVAWVASIGIHECAEAAEDTRMSGRVWNLVRTPAGLLDGFNKPVCCWRRRRIHPVGGGTRDSHVSKVSVPRCRYHDRLCFDESLSLVDFQQDAKHTVCGRMLRPEVDLHLGEVKHRVLPPRRLQTAPGVLPVRNPRTPIQALFRRSPQARFHRQVRLRPQVLEPRERPRVQQSQGG